MKRDRNRFLAATALFAAWLACLGFLAARSSWKPVEKPKPPALLPNRP